MKKVNIAGYKNFTGFIVKACGQWVCYDVFKGHISPCTAPQKSNDPDYSTRVVVMPYPCGDDIDCAAVDAAQAVFAAAGYTQRI